MTKPETLRPVGVPTPLAALLEGAPDVPVTGLSLSSAAVCPGDLYVALPGASTHGARFVPDAVAAGAVAVLTDPAGRDLAGAATPAVPIVVVADPRAELGRLAVEIYRHPAERLNLYGITGTTGKTSTTFLLAAGLAAAGQRVGTIGTIGLPADFAASVFGRIEP